MQRLPEFRAVIGMQAVGHLMGDDIIDHPLRPIPDLLTDADMPIGRSTRGAGAQPGFHRLNPADGFPLDIAVKILAVDQAGAFLQVFIGAAAGKLALFFQLAADRLKQLGEDGFWITVWDA